MKQVDVTIFEAAFLIDDLFIRVDILEKKGNKINLIEVKAKSYAPDNENLFIGKRGGMVKDWKPYLFDIAFQHFVVTKCLPSCDVIPFIMMADKSKKASIDGMNQLFRATKKANNRTGIISLADSIDDIGESVLGQINLTEIIEGIYCGKYKYHDNMSFEESIDLLRDHYVRDDFFNWDTSFTECKGCEYKATVEDEENGLISGFKNCFSKLQSWSDSDFDKANTFSIWNFRKGTKLMKEGVIFQEDLTEDSVGVKEEANRLSASERQWIQIEKELNNDESNYVDSSGLKEQMDKWKFPLHFIDFETSTVALPFNKGRRPYEQIAFQFSHHIYYEDGKIEHASEYINTVAGFFPNFEFIRELKKALSVDNGTIFKFATHENTIVNAIMSQLNDSNEPDIEELSEFIKGISHSKKDSAIKWLGERDMVDLCEIVKHYYYNPRTGGSNSIKAVLPAVLEDSKFLQNKYSKPIGELGISSKNFDSNHYWLKVVDGEVVSPYKMLPKVFEGWTEEEIERTLSNVEDVDNGGAALTTYGKLQYTDMEDEEREQLSSALLKYCELDTLAMVMIYEHFKEDLI